MFRARIIPLLIVVFATAVFNSIDAVDAQELKRIAFAGKTMGPIDYSVVVAVDSGKFERQSLKSAIEESLESVNQRMSTYIPESDVSRFNSSTSTDWFPVDRETAIVVQRSLEISQLSNGAFDMTVGPAVELWNFGKGREDRKFEIPSDDEIKKVKQFVGFEKVEARLDPPAIRKQISGARIDLSAIAKGYAVDRVATSLKELGVENMIVVVGGEVYSEGVSEKGRGWRTGIEKASERSIAVDRVVSLDAKAVATSGDYRNFSMVDGQRYSHTIDPRTCRPVTNQLALAAVIANDCMTADGIATAVMVLGREKGIQFCKDNGFELYAVERNSADPMNASKFIKTHTESFPFVQSRRKSGQDALAGAWEQLNQIEGEGNQPKRKTASTIRVFLAAAGLFGLAILGMAIGAMFGNKPIQGSCGGLANMRDQNGEIECAVCEKPATDCKEKDNVEAGVS